MKARTNPAALLPTSKNLETGLETTQTQELSKMKVAPRILMKTKGQKKCS
jgi:hypothetical protein